MALLLVFVSRFLLHAEPPTLDALYPAGAQRDSTNIVTAVGKVATWPSKVWISGDGVRVNAETNKGKLTITVSSTASAGPRLVRLYNEEGASEPRFFVVGAGRERGEAEPNNHFAKAQRIDELPVTINGRLDKNGDVDSFAITMRSGEWLDARVDSYVLMSKVDAVLRLVNTNGEQLAWNHDFVTLDPRLVWRATNHETVVLQIFGFVYPPASEVALTGGEGIVYRLHLNLTNAAPRLCVAPTEQEPNDSVTTAQAVDVPSVISGTIETANDEDRFRFTARKDEVIEARVSAASFGSPLAAWLKIEDAAGSSLIRNDDAESTADPRVEWKAASNGTYVAAIGSLTHHGGDDYCYKLSLKRLSPDYRATLGAGSIVLTAGATNELKFELKRLRGFSNDLTVVMENLPPGVTPLKTNLTVKDVTAAIPLAVTTNAAPSHGAVRVKLRDPVTGHERPVPFELTTKGETGYAHLVVEECDELWMTVKAAPPAKAAK